MTEKISAGCDVFDKLLEGGIEKDVITTIYGPAGSGKSTACLLASISVANSGKKVLYIDTEGGFSITRLGQLAGSNKSIANILFFRPTNFDHQKKYFTNLRSLTNNNVGLLVVDTITNLYRSERSDDNSELNRELGKQISTLLEIVRTKNIPALITNQVYADLDRKNVRMVGGDIISYNSKCIIELKTIHGNKRIAVLQRHRDIPAKQLTFEILGDGFSEFIHAP